MRNPFAAPVTKKTYESDGAPFLPVGTGTVLKEPSQRSAPSSGGSSGGGGTGGGSIGYFGGNTFGGGGGGGSAPAPVVTAPSKEDYLAGDSGFQTQKSALLGALERYLSDVDFQRSTYTTDYGKSLRDLGYDEGQGTWNWEDPITASGRGYQNQLNDFAGRNMLQSQGYADAFNELQRMLGQQYDALSGAKTTFMTDLDNQTANYKAENTASQQAARAEALQRRAAQYGL
jgi:hypothetical protein|tara:strand:- start:5608 stop:6297 length:690 start_codon:yes stop_codon:yes gene_type:complete